MVNLQLFRPLSIDKCIYFIVQGGGTQVRFQPNRGRYIASVGNGISIHDVETTQMVANQFKVGCCCDT